MLADLQTFTNSEFGSLRVVTREGEPWFVATDIAKALGYKDATHLTRRLDDDEKGLHSMETPGGAQQVSIISEPGLYNAILGSKVPHARTFKRWVTHDVLPALRRDGAYVASNGTEDDATLIARALIAAQRQIDAKNQRIQEQAEEIAHMRPKALFADAVAASDGTCLVGELAKMLRQNGVEIGQNRLFKRLREDGFLGKSGSNYNVPTQNAVARGLFRIKETAITHSDGHVTVTRTPKVTGRGQRYFIERYSETPAVGARNERL